MKLITRLPHDAKVMEDSIFGWDIFRCRDYGNIDGVINKPMDFSEVSKMKAIFGYTIIFAINIKGLKFFKRLFVRTT
jgi:hypothetical protein